MLTPLHWLLHWPVQSQARSRRNALLANTALVARRHEREEVDRFLDGLIARAVPGEQPRRPSGRIGA